MLLITTIISSMHTSILGEKKILRKGDENWNKNWE